MRDVEYDQDARSPYECFDCGVIVYAESSRLTCPECGGDLRNRRTPME